MLECGTGLERESDRYLFTEKEGKGGEAESTGKNMFRVMCCDMCENVLLTLSLKKEGLGRCLECSCCAGFRPLSDSKF